VFLLILDSLGSTELLFILIMALVFFGPRKLPQLSRSLGKGLAEFRKASEDFKHTWEREVALEESRADFSTLETADYEDNSIMNPNEENGALPEPITETGPPESTIARQTASTTTETSSSSAETVETGNDLTQPEALRKQNWL
jgi:Tat protein translocase TatB subunit